MPIHEFKCKKGHITEKLFLTFAEAEEIGSAYIHCPKCSEYPALAARIAFSLPGQAILLGEGFYKPAASGRTQTRGADPSKAAKEFIGEIGGAKNLVNAVKGSK